MHVGTGGQKQLGKHQQPVHGPQEQDCNGVELPGLLLKGGWQLWEPPPRAKPEAAPPGDALSSLQVAGGQELGRWAGL